mgnify:CR=1 FL=1
MLRKLKKQKICLKCAPKWLHINLLKSKLNVMPKIMRLKCAVVPEQVEQLVSKIVRDLESIGESEISSETIGETVMENLRTLDDVAYVRFASVYRNFREPKDFEQALAELTEALADGKIDATEQAFIAAEAAPVQIVPSMRVAPRWLNRRMPSDHPCTSPSVPA